MFFFSDVIIYYEKYYGHGGMAAEKIINEGARKKRKKGEMEKCAVTGTKSGDKCSGSGRRRITGSSTMQKNYLMVVLMLVVRWRQEQSGSITRSW